MRPLPRAWRGRGRGEDPYVAWLSRSLIAAGRADEAWDLVAAHEAGGGARDVAGLLRLVGDGAYRAGAFLVAARVRCAI